MRILEFKEEKPRGSDAFPVEAYHLDGRHPQYIMPCHWHEECELIYIKSGSFAYAIETERGVARAGELLFVGGGMLHEGMPREAVYHCAVFGLDLLMKAGAAIQRQLLPFAEGESRVYTRLPPEDGELTALAERLFSVIAAERPGYQLQTQGLLAQMLGHVMEKGYYTRHMVGNTGDQKKRRQLKNALALIEDGYASPLTLEQLARAAGMSPKYFCHFFQRMTRHTPIEYLNRHRTEVARCRLAAGCGSVTELAYECGFNDLSYFIRVFKRYVGTTPKRYAAAHGQREMAR